MEGTSGSCQAHLKTPGSTLSPSRLMVLARRLAWFTIFYNLLEGALSVYFGLEEGAASLVAFGLDSFIESASAVVVLWQIGRGTSEELGSNERPALLAIGLLFLMLALATWAGSLAQLWQGGHPRSTLPGMIIALVSLSFMFYLWSAKRKLGILLGSQVLLKDAACSLACIQLSVVLLIGSVTFELAPVLWWIDASAALLLGGLIFREGWSIVFKAWRGEEVSCCD